MWTIWKPLAVVTDPVIGVIEGAILTLGRGIIVNPSSGVARLVYRRLGLVGRNLRRRPHIPRPRNHRRLLEEVSVVLC